MNANAGFPQSETVFELAGDWKSDILTLVKKEIELAKTEMSEKVSFLGRNSIFIVAGGVCALMAVFILFLGLGGLIAWALRKAGLNIGLSYFIGYCGLGLLLAGAGYGLIMKGIHAISSAKLAPEKTIATIREIKGEQPSRITEVKVDVPKRSSDQIRQEVEITRTRIEQEAEEIRSRVTPKHMCKTAWAITREHPIRLALISAVTGLSSFALWKLRMRGRLLRAVS